MRANVMLCDWANVVDGSLFVQGGGRIAVQAGAPLAQISIAVLLEVAYTETHRPHDCTIRALTQDGVPYPDEQPIELGFGFKIDRPEALPAGMSQPVPYAAQIYGVPFEPGIYVIEVVVDGEIATTLSFAALQPDPAAGAV